MTRAVLRLVCGQADAVRLPRRLLVIVAVFALAATACRSGGSDQKSTSTTAPSAASSGATPPPLGKPNPRGAKWDWSRLDAFKPYLASLSGGATFYDFAWCEIEPERGDRNWQSVDRVAST